MVAEGVTHLSVTEFISETEADVPRLILAEAGLRLLGLVWD
tara:strand:+ start:21930 stop:22052 length:123 start_codon:yes stop_codon:yes gene_type:complete